MAAIFKHNIQCWWFSGIFPIVVFGCYFLQKKLQKSWASFSWLLKKLSCTTLIRYWSPEEYSGLDLSPGLPLLPLNMVFFNPKGCWKTPLDFVKFWLYQAFSRVGYLLHWSWVAYTNACRIELCKKLSCTALIRYRSPEEYSGLDLSPGLPCFLLIWYSLIPEVVGKPHLTSSNLAVPGLPPCGLPAPLELGDLHKCVQDWAL